MTSTTPDPALPPPGRLWRWLDARLHLGEGVLRRAFPEGPLASFLLGEVALASILLLGITGIYLGLGYHPSVGAATYHGNVGRYDGHLLPEAYASVLRISYDVPLGMTVRMVHHWASYLLVASVSLHLLRVLLTGAFRNPREVNWLAGVVLLVLVVAEGFTGYALPYDGLSMEATSVAVAVVGSTPLLGPLLVQVLFGGAFPAEAAAVLPRLFFLHVYLLPALLLATLAFHLLVVWRQKHTVARPDADAGDDLQGRPLVPDHLVVSLAVLLATAGVVAVLAGLFPVQDLLRSGPADPTTPPPSATPDWYLLWILGLLALTPSVPGGPVLAGLVVPLALLGLLAAVPFLHRSPSPVHGLERPRDHPVRTAAVVAGVDLLAILSLAGMGGTLAQLLDIPLGTLTWLLRLLVVAVPALAGVAVWAALRAEPRD